MAVVGVDGYLDSVVREGLSRKGHLNEDPEGKWTSPESVREKDSRQECVYRSLKQAGNMSCLS